MESFEIDGLVYSLDPIRLVALESSALEKEAETPSPRDATEKSANEQLKTKIVNSLILAQIPDAKVKLVMLSIVKPKAYGHELNSLSSSLSHISVLNWRSDFDSLRTKAERDDWATSQFRSAFGKLQESIEKKAKEVFA